MVMTFRIAVVRRPEHHDLIRFRRMREAAE
jgi:hypothetical protein